MVQARVEHHPGIPWTLRLFDAVPLPPIWIGLLITAAVLLVYAAYAYAAGWIEGFRLLGEPFWESSQFGLELIQALMIGFAPTAIAYGLRGAVRDVHDLRPALRCSEAEFQHELQELTRLGGSSAIIVRAIGVALGLSMPFYGPGWPEGQAPALGDPLLTWALLRNVLVFSLYAAAIDIDITVARRLSRIGERWAEVDLLDLSPLAPFARRGLRSVLLWVPVSILLSLLFLAPWAPDIPILALIWLLGVALAVLLLPLLGVHRRIRATKDAELTRVRAQIHSERDGTGATHAGLANLIAYETRIASVGTWPIDVSTLLRFSFYVALGVGSWLGGALVERLLGALLD